MDGLIIFEAPHKMVWLVVGEHSIKEAPSCCETVFFSAEEAFDACEAVSSIYSGAFSVMEVEL